MAKLTRDDILKLARLARIDVTDEEVTEFTAEFNAILGYVEQLQAVDTDGLEPTNQVTGQVIDVSRDDVVADYGYDVKDLQANVPAMQDDHIKVKRMLV
jgi:aspartyl-tRNA(Asn)/glutamyl-tRNA(Gln) amidotransferase subunit C